MIKTTIREALNRTIGDVGDHMLYMVRDGDTVFYIGHSYDPLSRLETHMASSTLGTVIKANMPRSYDWQYELLTFADCARYLPMTSRYATGKGQRS